MTHGDGHGHGDLDGRRLFFKAAGAVDQAVVHKAIGGIVVGLGARRAVDLVQGLGLAVFEQRAADGIGAADKCDAVGPGIGDDGVFYGDAAVVFVYKDGIAADLVNRCVLDSAVFGAVKENGPAAICRPVAAQERLLVVHESAGSVAECDSLESDEADGILLGAAEFDQVAEADHFDSGGVEFHVSGWIKIKRRGLGVEEPFAGCIQFLKDILDEAEFCGGAGLWRLFCQPPI